MGARVSVAEHPPPDTQRRTIRLLTVDDQVLFREATRAVVALMPDFEVVAEAADGDEAIRLAREVDPDMVILDVRMLGRDGFDTAGVLTREDPTRVVVLVSSADVRELSALARASGAAALLRKHWLTPRLLRGLWVAHRRR
jgi:DNA-binding NarL/FixJ family response regulator